jgi:hypothetical protein
MAMPTVPADIIIDVLIGLTLISKSVKSQITFIINPFYMMALKMAGI